MKTITKRDLSQMVQTRLDLGIACHRIGKHYCRPMQLRGQCDESCPNCTTKIQAIMNRIGTKGDMLYDPAAVLVWSCRTQIAEIDESNEQAATPVTDWLGQRTTTNIFELFEKTI
jgi:hypothetical protein